MTAYEQAHAEALRALEKYDAVPFRGHRSLSHQVTSLSASKITKAKDIAGTFGRSVQRVTEIIGKLTMVAKA